MRSQVLFRAKAFSLHLLGSASVLGIVVGGLYLGWYRWPGWYLADATQVTRMLIGVDLVVGPLLTMVIASPRKPLRTLGRDIAVIAAIQLFALGYGSVSLWNGRPMYYAFSEDLLQLVQAYDIEVPDAQLGRKENPTLAPHWYNLPRWVWAPLPADGDESGKIIASAITGGTDVIGMPKYYKGWNEGLKTLRSQLKKVDDLKYFSGNEKKRLKQRMRDRGLEIDQLNSIAFTGRAHPLLAVFDPDSLEIVAILQAQ